MCRWPEAACGVTTEPSSAIANHESAVPALPMRPAHRPSAKVPHARGKDPTHAARGHSCEFPHWDCWELATGSKVTVEPCPTKHAASDCHALAAQDWSTQRPQHVAEAHRCRQCLRTLRFVKRKIHLDHFENGVYHSFISINWCFWEWCIVATLYN